MTRHRWFSTAKCAHNQTTRKYEDLLTLLDSFHSQNSSNNTKYTHERKKNPLMESAEEVQSNTTTTTLTSHFMEENVTALTETLFV